MRHMGAVLSEFENKLFPAMAARHTDMPVVPEGARSSTMNINSIHGGQKENDPDFDGLPAHCVPDSCRITIDRRFLLEEPLDQVRGEVRALLEGLRETRVDFDYELTELNSVLPSMTDRDAPVVGVPPPHAGPRRPRRHPRRRRRLDAPPLRGASSREPLPRPPRLRPRRRQR